MSQVNDFIQYIITKGFNEEDAIVWVKDLEKGGKLTLPAVDEYLDCKRRIAESKEEYPVKEKSNFGKRFIDSKPDYKIDIEDFNESEALKLNCKQGIPIDNTGLPFNEVGIPPMDSEVYQNGKEVDLDNSEVYLTGNINMLSTKVDDLLRDRTKNLAKKLKISVSALIRNILIEKIDEWEDKEYE